MTLSRARAEELLRQFGDRRILVVGDLMLDRYIYGVVDRISPEAPVPVVLVRDETMMPGGASNVACNLKTLGGASEVAGLVGGDAEAETLRALLRAGGVGVAGCCGRPEVRTTIKTRVIAERQQIVRVDREAPLALDAAGSADFCGRLRELVATVDGVIIEDYGKGAVSQAVVDAVLAAATARGVPVGYDPKDGHPLNVQGITVATPNRKEAYGALGEPEPLDAGPPLEDERLLSLGRRLQEKWGVAVLIITLGPQGMVVMEAGRDAVHVPTRAREVFDVSGAGDTVIAACTLALAAGATAIEAAELANYAAGVVVGQVGTAPCHAADLLGSIP
jgi:D-glycero-beta-D-manno-heptose-7-phosphate kinase